MKFVATFEVDFTEAEVKKFKDLANQIGKSFPETVRMCANDKADELLKMFELNVPDIETLNGNNLGQTRDRTEQET
jgi:hypothetical protein